MSAAGDARSRDEGFGDGNPRDESRRNEARDRFTRARVARLATADADGRPHLVPIVFALVDDVVWSAVDGKPKSTRALRRLANIRANPRVSLLVDHYSDDWSALWWVRLDGEARVVDLEEPGPGAPRRGPGVAAARVEALRAIEGLAAKYEQYQTDPPAGPLVRITATRWAWWSHTPST